MPDRAATASEPDPIIVAGLAGVRWFEETYGAFTDEELAAADERIRQSDERIARANASVARDDP